jgi:hypothetical protein
MTTEARLLGGTSLGLVVLSLMLVGCGRGDESVDLEADRTIDQRSYRLGGIGAFAEMVGAGVKKLALSAPMDPEEMDALMEDAATIAADHGVELYRETDFLVTDLFPAELTAGKHVLLIYRDATRGEYSLLKQLKSQLVESGAYDEQSRIEVARTFGALLSYPDEKIDALLAEGGPRD